MKVAIFAILLLALFVPLAAQATVYDLGADWSNDHNPFGAWTLMKSPTEPFTINQPNYMQDGTGMHAWADQPYALLAHVPFWTRMEVPSDQFDLWDIELHGAEYDRTGTNQTSAVWTSPETGTAVISGATWEVRALYRTMAWELRKNGVALTGGTLYGNGGQMHDAPFNLNSGWGGAGVLTQAVVPGDTIEMVFTTITDGGNVGDALGLKLTIATSTISTSPAGWLNAGWNYFSIPDQPLDPSIPAVFGGQEVQNRLYQWDGVNKNMILYPGDITHLTVGQGYLLRLDGDMTVSYAGTPNTADFGIPIPEEGWTWIGQPFDYDTLISTCRVRNNATGVTRTAAGDVAAIDPWLNWNTVWWDSAIDSWKLAGLSSCDDYYFRPWRGYLVWANARSLTLIVPKQ